MGKRRVGPGQSALPKSGGPRESPEGSGKRRAVLALVLLVVAAFAACVAGISNGLVQDDEAILLADNRLQDFTGWREILTLPYWPPPSLPDQYRPVTSFFLAFQNVIGSGEPAMFRIVSYLLYAAASVAVFRLALRFFPFAIALSVALLFAAHPVHVEATALAVAQSEILVAILIVAAVGLYVARRSSPAGILRSRDWGLIAALYVIAAFIKEQGLLLPAFLLLAEVCLVRDVRWRSRLRVLWIGYAVLALIGIAILAIRFQVLGQQAVQPNVAEALVGKTFGVRALTTLRVVPEWTRLLIFPAHLRLDYSPRELMASSSLGAPEALGLLLLALAAAVAWLMRARAPVVTLGLLWCA